MISFTKIASGSDGNFYIISDGETKIMIECGIPFSQIHKALRFDMPDFKGCIISHEHEDHCKALCHILKNTSIPCYLTNGTFLKIKKKQSIENKYLSFNLKIIRSFEEFKIGSFRIMAFPTEHDAGEPVGYLLRSGQNKILYATDTYFLKYKFHRLTHIIIECNYDMRLLNENIENGTVHPELKSRIMRSHMELDILKDFFRANDLSAVRGIFLIHMSRNNMDPEMAKEEIMSLTGKPVYI